MMLLESSLLNKMRQIKLKQFFLNLKKIVRRTPKKKLKAKIRRLKRSK